MRHTHPLSLRGLLACAAMLLSACSSNEPRPAPEADPATRVSAPAGTFVGFTDPRGARVWRGLRYARPPIDHLRWRAPLPSVPNSDETLALDFGDVCPQIGSPLGGAPDAVAGKLWGSEDCLFLNVYAPDRERSELPVMVWIHGGGNTVGHAGFYDGVPLVVAHDVVVVTLNYRLGPFGWLHHPALAGESPEDASGNYGTLDLVRALEWVRDNIASFGGDPARVTVFGESAGASNIVSLLVAPAAADLFHGAILQSGGTASVSIAEARDPNPTPDPGRGTSSGDLLLRAVRAPGCDEACAAARIDAMTLAEQEAVLRDLDAGEVFALYGDDLLGPDSPSIIRDGAVLPLDPFPEVLATPGRYHAVPTILGTNRDEPKIFMAFDPRRVASFAGLPLWVKNARSYGLHAEYGALAWRIRGVDDPARALDAADVPVWTYRWDWDEEGTFAFVDLSEILGAAHGLEIPFVFGHFDVGSQTSLIYNDGNAEGRTVLAERMMAYWAGFARDLDPGTGADGRGPLWAPFDPDAGTSFLRLDTGPDGIEMRAETIDFEGFVERLEKDARFENVAERCEVFDGAVYYDGREATREALERLGCAHP